MLRRAESEAGEGVVVRTDESGTGVAEFFGDGGRRAIQMPDAIGTVRVAADDAGIPDFSFKQGEGFRAFAAPAQPFSPGALRRTALSAAPLVQPGKPHRKGERAERAHLPALNEETRFRAVSLYENWV